MDADTQSGQISDENDPTVAMRFVGYIFPLQNKPEYNGCEQGRIGINLPFYGAEPESVTAAGGNPAGI